MKFFGVDFVPVLTVSRKRKLEALSVFAWANLFIWSGPVFLALLYCLYYYTRLWPLSVVYFAWFFYDLDTCNRGGGKRYFAQ